MDPRALLGLCVYEEAQGEPDEGKAAVARVVKNRMKRRFFSDGTIEGTVLAKDQFSWAWFDFVTRISGTGATKKSVLKYERICHTNTEARALAEDKLKRALRRTLERCTVIGDAVMADTFRGPLFDQLGDGAVSYLNPRILTKLPKWVIPSALVVKIGHHDFYRYVPPKEGVPVA